MDNQIFNQGLEYLKNSPTLKMTAVIIACGTTFLVALWPILQGIFGGPRGAERLRVLAETRKLLLEGMAISKDKEVSLPHAEEQALLAMWKLEVQEPLPDIRGETKFKRRTRLIGLVAGGVVMILPPQQFALGMLKLLSQSGWLFLGGALLSLVAVPALTFLLAVRYVANDLTKREVDFVRLGARLTVMCELVLVLGVTLTHTA